MVFHGNGTGPRFSEHVACKKRPEICNFNTLTFSCVMDFLKDFVSFEVMFCLKKKKKETNKQSKQTENQKYSIKGKKYIKTNS